jgi:hypothetical protein
LARINDIKFEDSSGQDVTEKIRGIFKRAKVAQALDDISDSVAKGVIDSVMSEDVVDTGLFLQVTYVPRLHLTGQVRMPVTATIPVGKIPWPILRSLVYHNEVADNRDWGFVHSKITVPLRDELITQFRRKYPAAGDKILSNVCNTIKDDSHAYSGIFIARCCQIKLVKADGSSAEDLLQPLERDYVRSADVLGEEEQELGWVDPEGVLVPKDLWAKYDIVVSALVRKGHIVDIPVKIMVSIPHDVEWASAASWSREWLIASFVRSNTVPYVPKQRTLNTHRLKFCDDREGEKIKALIRDCTWAIVTIDSDNAPEWVTRDGKPYPTAHVQRRYVKRILDQG